MRIKIDIVRGVPISGDSTEEASGTPLAATDIVASHNCM